MDRKTTDTHTEGAKRATRKKSPRRGALTPAEQADIDAFRLLQPMSQRALAKTLRRVIRPK